MTATRDVIKEYERLLDIDITIVSTEVLWTDRDEVLAITMVNNLLLAGVGVFCAVLLFVQPFLALFIFLTVVMIDVDLFGLMKIWGMDIEITTFASAAMALGLSVDYVIHTTAYMLHLPERISLPERITRTYAEMGASVVNGGFSTFLGIVLLAGARSLAFRRFFRVLFGTVVFGVLHGIVFAPIALYELYTWYYAVIGHDHYGRLKQRSSSKWGLMSSRSSRSIA